MTIIIGDGFGNKIFVGNEYEYFSIFTGRKCTEAKSVLVQIFRANQLVNEFIVFPGEIYPAISHDAYILWCSEGHE